MSGIISFFEDIKILIEYSKKYNNQRGKTLI